MKRTGYIVLATLALAGCQSAAEKAEIADDDTCRKLIVERSDARPEAYKECRGNLMAYRQQGAVARSGRTTIQQTFTR